MTIIKFILISLLRTFIHPLRLELVLMERNFRLALLNKLFSLSLMGINLLFYRLIIKNWLSIWNLLNWNLLNLNGIRCMIKIWINLRIISCSRILMKLLKCFIACWRLSGLTCPSRNTNYLNFIANWWLLFANSDDAEV